jgi:hypothetical protein
MDGIDSATPRPSVYATTISLVAIADPEGRLQVMSSPDDQGDLIHYWSYRQLHRMLL